MWDKDKLLEILDYKMGTAANTQDNHALQGMMIIYSIVNGVPDGVVRSTVESELRDRKDYSDEP